MKKLNFLTCFIFSVQKIELQKMNVDSSDIVRGHIVISLISRDRSSASPRLTDVNELAISPSLDDPTELPDGWVSFH